MINKILKNIKYIKIKDFFAVFIFLLALPCSMFFKLYNKIKKRDLWLICENGRARDNGYHFYKYIRENYPDKNVYFVIDKKIDDYEKVKKYGNIIDFKSFKHWIYYLAADFNIVSHKDGNPSKAFLYVIQVLFGLIRNRVFLQHGVIKDYLDWLIYENTKFKYFICGAKEEWQYVKENYNYPEGSVVYTGLPRFDNLHNFCSNKKQILIMPTWREWLGKETNFLGEKVDFLKTDYFKNFNNLLNNKKLINYIEEKNINLLFYPHISMQKYLKNFDSTSKNIKFLDLDYDIQEILKSSSLLVTDYSSVFMDFAYMRKPIIYFQFDQKEYREKHYQEGYFSYENNGFGKITKDVEQTVDKIISYIENEYKIEDVYLSRMNNFFELYDNKNCFRIYQLLENDKKQSKRIFTKK